MDRPSERSMPAFGHIPALDGLRGLAVGAVVVFHAGYLAGGYLGVDLFFVLSGFLITSLLLAESHTTGSVGLGHFWSRRARRLLPALAGMLIGVILYCAFVAQSSQLVGIRGEAFATIGYVANWRQVFAKQDYFALFTASSPLQHTWSLAIEEQFYLIWPLVFVALMSKWRRTLPKAVFITSLALAAASNVLMFALYHASNLSRVYYGTDTRAGGILLGAALAAWLALRGPVTSVRARRTLELVAVAGAAVLAVAWTKLHGQSSALYRGGFLVCELSVVAILAAAAHPQPGPVARVLSFKPLRLLGLISYGVYLWHWPVDVWLNTSRTHLDGFTLFALQCIVTLSISTASFVLLERPIRRGAWTANELRLFTPVVAASLALLLVASTAGAASPAKVNTTFSSSELNRAVGDAFKAPSAMRVMVVGNSVASYLGETMKTMQSERHIVVLNAALAGCYFPADIHVVRFKNVGGGYTELKSGACDANWTAEVKAFHPQIVLWIQSDAGDGDAQINGKWLHPCDAAWNANYETGWRDAITSLQAGGAHVAIATAAYSAISFHVAHPEDDCDNHIRHTAAEATGAQLVDLFARVCPNRQCHVKEHGVTLRPDGVHYLDEGARIIATWLLDQLQVAPK